VRRWLRRDYSPEPSEQCSKAGRGDQWRPEAGDHPRGAGAQQGAAQARCRRAHAQAVEAARPGAQLLRPQDLSPRRIVQDHPGRINSTGAGNGPGPAARDVKSEGGCACSIKARDRRSPTWSGPGTATAPSATQTTTPGRITLMFPSSVPSSRSVMEVALISTAGPGDPSHHDERNRRHVWSGLVAEFPRSLSDLPSTSSSTAACRALYSRISR
jgi:hypothetical protein